MDKIVHFEIPVDDMDRAKKFYSIFGWQMDDIPGMDYVGIRTVDVDEKQQPVEKGAINGGMMKRTDAVKAPIVAINIDSIDNYVEKIVEAGGKIVTPKIKIGEIGYYSYITDTEGNVIGLWEEIVQPVKQENESLVSE